MLSGVHRCALTLQDSFCSCLKYEGSSLCNFVENDEENQLNQKYGSVVQTTRVIGGLSCNCNIKRTNTTKIYQLCIYTQVRQSQCQSSDIERSSSASQLFNLSSACYIDSVTITAI